VPAVLTFNYEEAKKHLIEVDHRFEDLFRKMKCKPFEQLEQVHPFRYERSFLSNEILTLSINYQCSCYIYFVSDSDFRLVIQES
jgi:hypothetical protein